MQYASHTIPSACTDLFRLFIYIAARYHFFRQRAKQRSLLGLDYLIGLDGDVLVRRKRVDGALGELGTVMDGSVSGTDNHVFGQRRDGYLAIVVMGNAGGYLVSGAGGWGSRT